MTRAWFVGRRGALLAVVFIVVAAGCGASSTTAGTGGSTTSTGSTTTVVGSLASTSIPVASGSTQVELSDGDTGRTLPVRRGDVITVVLHSTYWAMLPPADPTVLQPEGSTAVVPQLDGCVAGQGCGTVTTRYRAVSAGRSELAARRDSCGEALRCTADQQSWQAIITVT